MISETHYVVFDGTSYFVTPCPEMEDGYDEGEVEIIFSTTSLETAFRRTEKLQEELQETSDGY